MQPNWRVLVLSDGSLEVTGTSLGLAVTVGAKAYFADSYEIANRIALEDKLIVATLKLIRI